jgi:hypothetical protein
MHPVQQGMTAQLSPVLAQDAWALARLAVTVKTAGVIHETVASRRKNRRRAQSTSPRRFACSSSPLRWLIIAPPAAQSVRARPGKPGPSLHRPPTQA